MAKILLIDDEPDLLELMSRALADTNHEVTMVSNGSYVLNGDTGLDFDLVVTDIVMPEVEGIETLTYLLRHNPKIRIIAISGGGCIDASFHLRLAGRLGAYLTLPKPFTLRMFVDAVEQALRQKQGADDAGSASRLASEIRETCGGGR